MTADRHIPDEQLPLWMKQARRGVDWGALLVILLALLAARPILMNPHLPDTNQVLTYVWQAETAAQMIDTGVIYPRWSPVALRGYGAPFPNFYSPTVPMLSGLLSTFFQADSIMAVRVVMILSYVAGGMALYVLVTHRSRARAGIVSAVLYLYSPYMVLILPHQTGDVQQMLAMAFLPMFLWSINRILRRNQPVDVLYIMLTGAALLITEPYIFGAGLMLAGLLCGYMLYEGTSFQRVTSAVTGGICGIGLAAFYWFPALINGAAVQWYDQDSIAAIPRVIAGDLLQWPQSLDASALVYPPQWSIGFAILLSLLLSGIVIWRMRRVTFQAVFGLAGLVPVVGVLLFPQQTWLFGVMIVCLAIGGSGFLLILENYSFRVQAASLMVCVIGLLLLSWSTLITPAAAGQIDDTSFEAQIAYEAEYYGIATLPSDMRVPATVEPQTLRDAASLTGRVRVPADSDAFIQPEQESLLMYRYNINTDEAVQAVFSQMYFPAVWRATLDGRSVPVSRLENGLVGLALPAQSDGILTIRFVPDMTHTLSWFISGMALLIAGSIFWLRWRRRTIDYDAGDVLHRSSVAGVLLVITGVGFLVPYLESLRPAPGYRLADATILNVPTRFGPNLLAYDVPTRAAAGGVLPVTLYWNIEQPIPLDYTVTLSLRDADDRDVLSDTEMPGHFPVSRWQPGYYVPDTRRLELPADIPDGQYTLNIAVNNCQPVCAVGGIMPFVVSDTGTNDRVQQDSLILPVTIQIGTE